MATDTPDIAPELVDRERLGEYLERELGTGYGTFSVERLGAGQSCLTFLLDGGDWRLVLRRPPRGDLPPTAFDVAREFRIMSVLRDERSGIPVPNVKLLCTDREVIGASFYLMEPVDGLVLRGMPGDDFGPALRAAAAADVVDLLADLHDVDWAAAGLRDFGNPGAYAERQMARVQKLWERARFREISVIDRLGELLRETAPVDGLSGIVHGDYKLDNVILSPATGRLAAVIDWELSTIGDPLADLGWLTYYWLDDESEGSWPGMPRQMLSDGFPKRAELYRRYDERRSAPAPTVRWYAALAGWKCAVMLEGSYRRFVEGTADIASYAALERGVPYLAERGLAFATGELGLAQT